MTGRACADPRAATRSSAGDGLPDAAGGSPWTHSFWRRRDGARRLKEAVGWFACSAAPLLADDHGDTRAAATAITTSGTGRIGDAADVDVFSFTAPDPTTVTVTGEPSAVSPNLDLSLTLFDAAGTLLATDDPASGHGNDPGWHLPRCCRRHRRRLAVVRRVLRLRERGALHGHGQRRRVRGGGRPGGVVAHRRRRRGRHRTGITVEAWVQTSPSPHTQGVLSRWLDGENQGESSLSIGVNGNLMWITDESSARRPVDLRAPASELFNGQPHHVAATWAPSGVTLHVDGDLVATTPSPGGELNRAGEAEMRIGSTSGPGHPGWFAGVVEEAAVYDRALTTSEIAAIHAAGAAGKCSP